METNVRSFQCANFPRNLCTECIQFGTKHKMPLTYVDFNMNFLLTKTPNLCKNLIKFVDSMSCSNTKKTTQFHAREIKQLQKIIQLNRGFDGCNQMRD